MFLTRKKTEEEINGAATEEEMKVHEYNDKFMSGSKTLWHCDVHGILFEENDRIIARVWGKENSAHCSKRVPVYKKLWFWRKQETNWKFCMRRLYCGDKAYWEKHYELASPKCTECGCSVVSADAIKCPWGHKQPMSH